MRTDSHHDVGKLINYFENFINDLNKDLTHNSKTNFQQQIRTTSQNTSNLTPTFTDTTQQPILPTIIDEDNINETINDRTFSEDIYDRLTYQTLINTNSYASHEQFIQSSIKSIKRRRHLNHHTNKKRLHHRRIPTYIKELKTYLAHRELSSNEITKISDVKKFSNVLVWLSNQTTSPSLIETSTPTSLIKTNQIDNTQHSLSITTDSVIAISQSYSDPIPPSTDEGNTSKSSSTQLITYLTYNNIRWKLKIRKEVFSPAETFDHPLLIELLYFQIVRDIFSSVCIRMSEAERTNMKIFLSSHGVVTIADINLIKLSSIKKTIIEQARQWSLYFSHLFPISLSKSSSNEVQILGISHSGIRLIKQTINTNIFQVLETFSYDIIQNISIIENNSTINLYLTKKCITIYSHRIKKIKQIIDKYLKEFQTLSNSSDLFKSSSQISLTSCSQTFSELIPSTSLDIHTPKRITSTEYSMMEFAIQNFKIPIKKRSKKCCKTSEWTWKDYTELLKWSKNPIPTSLLRSTPNNLIRITRQCFLCIIRFMGDYRMTRGQTDVDCLFYLLKNMHKHRKLIDEILCQILKQLTDNKSLKIDSIQRGWKLLAMILNYFIPSEYLQPYFIKYLYDNRNQNEKLVQLCLNYYEQTLKYGGRKTIPNKMEIDLLIANDRNGGTRQTFLLPGGFPLTTLTTPLMVINDCLNLLCEHLNISNALEIDEYSIFIISSTKNSSRLLNVEEYLFDILSEIKDFYLILKRILWFNIPFLLNKCEIFIDFMYYQLISEFLDGTMIILNNNHLSNELMQEISLMVALQYHISNKISLPSIKEIKYLLPGSILKLKNLHPQQWLTIIHDKLNSSVQLISIIEAKIKFLNLIQTWPLFGTTFFTVESINNNSSIRTPCLIGINKNDILFLDLDTRETIFRIVYNDIISIDRQQNIVNIKYENLNESCNIQCHINRIQDFLILNERYLSLINRTKEIVI